MTTGDKYRAAFRKAFYSNNGAGEDDRAKMCAAYDMAVYVQVFGHPKEAAYYEAIADFYFARHRVKMLAIKQRIVG